MKCPQKKHIVLITALLACMLSGLPFFAGIHTSRDSAMPDEYYQTQSSDSGHTLLTPSLMNYGLSLYVCNPRDSRRMSESEAAELSLHSRRIMLCSEKCIAPHDNHLLSYVSLRKHGFAYTGGEEDPFSPIS